MLQSGPLFDLRIGLVLFGGVSLAVYMNGVVQELLTLVRASQTQDPKNPYTRLLQAAGAEVHIDVIAGSSAGGLNGLVLAKALVTGSDAVVGMSDLWKRVAQVDQLVQTDEPHALFSGTLMEENLYKVLREMSESPNPELANQVPVFDCFITATDLKGRAVTRQDLFKNQINALRNQHTFHLKKRTRAADGRSYDQNDFLYKGENEAEVNRTRDAVLAKLGRATSAFPGALPPQNLTRQESARAKLEHLMPDTERDEVWFSDGGILMNKPFAPVVKTIFARSAEGPVERVLLWLDPAPQTAPASQGTVTAPEPHILEILAAALVLPRNEDVTAYLDQVKQQERFRDRIKEALHQVEEALNAGGTVLDGDPGPIVRGYQQVREQFAWSFLTESLRESFRQATWAAELPELLVGQLKGRFEGQALDYCDVEYHIRRLHYMLLMLEENIKQDSAIADERLLQLRRARAGQLERHLWNALEDWRNARWLLSCLATQGEEKELQAAFRELHEANAPTTEQVSAAVDRLEGWLRKVHAKAAAEERCAWEKAAEFPVAPAPAIAPQLLSERLQSASEAFGARDVLLFPMAQMGQWAEWDPITVGQISPGPTPWVPRPAHEKLASEVLGAFGGFLDPRWRHNDILWGRLDAAEMLCRLLVHEAGDYVREKGPLQRMADECLEQRYREILLEEIEILDMNRLQARYLQARSAWTNLTALQPAGMIPPELGKALGEAPAEFREAFEKFVQEAAPAALEEFPPGLKDRELILKAPIQVLRDYLTFDHDLGEARVSDLKPQVVVTGLLGGLKNLVQVLGRTSPGAAPIFKTMGNVLAGIIRPLLVIAQFLIPRGPLGRLVRALLVACTLGAVALPTLQLLGLITLAPAGWAVTGALLLPLAGMLLFAVGWAALAAAAIALALLAAAAWLLHGAGLSLAAPFAGLSGPGQLPLFLGLLALTLLAAALMLGLGRLPRTRTAPRRIISLELVKSVAEAQQILADWRREDEHADRRAAFQIGADFLFILGYAPLLALCAGLGGQALGALWPPLALVGGAMAWLQLLAGALDMVENIALMQLLLGTRSEGWPTLARSCARLKFWLVGAGLLFALPGLAYLFGVWPR